MCTCTAVSYHTNVHKALIQHTQPEDAIPAYKEKGLASACTQSTHAPRYTSSSSDLKGLDYLIRYFRFVSKVQVVGVDDRGR